MKAPVSVAGDGDQTDADAPTDAGPADDGAWPRKAMNAAAVVVSDNDSGEVRKLKAAINESLESLQRPYNHLRRLGPEGPADQHRRFLGYIELRTPIFDAAVEALVLETGEDRAAFMKSFAVDNRQVMESNRSVRELAAKASPPSDILISAIWCLGGF